MTPSQIPYGKGIFDSRGNSYTDATPANLQRLIDGVDDRGNTIPPGSRVIWVTRAMCLTEEPIYLRSNITLDFLGNMVVLNQDMSTFVFEDVAEAQLMNVSVVPFITESFNSHAEDYIPTCDQAQTEPIVLMDATSSDVAGCVVRNIRVDSGQTKVLKDDESTSPYHCYHVIGLKAQGGSIHHNILENIMVIGCCHGINVTLGSAYHGLHSNLFSNMLFYRCQALINFTVELADDEQELGPSCHHNTFQHILGQTDGHFTHTTVRNIPGFANHFDHILMWDPWKITDCSAIQDGGQVGVGDWIVHESAERTYICGAVYSLINRGENTRVVGFTPAQEGCATHESMTTSCNTYIEPVFACESSQSDDLSYRCTPCNDDPDNLYCNNLVRPTICYTDSRCIPFVDPDAGTDGITLTPPDNPCQKLVPTINGKCPDCDSTSHTWQMAKQACAEDTSTCSTMEGSSPTPPIHDPVYITTSTGCILRQSHINITFAGDHAEALQTAIEWLSNGKFCAASDARFEPIVPEIDPTTGCRSDAIDVPDAIPTIPLIAPGGGDWTYQNWNGTIWIHQPLRLSRPILLRKGCTLDFQNNSVTLVSDCTFVSVGQAVDTCVNAGVRNVRVIPYLSPDGQSRQTHPVIRLNMLPPIEGKANSGHIEFNTFENIKIDGVPDGTNSPGCHDGIHFYNSGAYIKEDPLQDNIRGGSHSHCCTFRNIYMGRVRRAVFFEKAQPNASYDNGHLFYNIHVDGFKYLLDHRSVATETSQEARFNTFYHMRGVADTYTRGGFNQMRGYGDRLDHVALTNWPTDDTLAQTQYTVDSAYCTAKVYLCANQILDVITDQDDRCSPHTWIYIDAPLAADQDLDRDHDPCLGRVVEAVPERVDGGCGGTS